MRSSQNHSAGQAATHADELFNSGWNCAESVFQAVYKQFRQDQPPVYLLTTLGGGMGCKRTCGAVTGGVIALGLGYGRTSPDEAAKKSARAAAHNFCQAFREEFHSLDCWELIEGLEDERQRKAVCTRYVRWAASRAAEMLRKSVEAGARSPLV